MAQGVFITFEGCEGAGKSTQIARLAEEFKRANIKFISVREPGGTGLGEEARRLLKDFTVDPPVDRAELMLFLAARAQLVEKVIRPALENGIHVISDRFSDSTIAYQGYGREMDAKKVASINEFATSGLKPDYTVLLHIEQEVSESRMRKREVATGTQADRIELAGADFHKRVRDGFCQIAKAEPDRFIVVDASQSADIVWSNIWTRLKHLV